MRNNISDIKSDLENLNKEIESVFKECDPNSLVELSSDLKEITKNVKTEITINNTLDNNTNYEVVLSTAENTLSDLKDLIILTKGITNHLYGQLISTDVTDPNLVAATAEFIKSTRESIADFIDIYRDERKFIHRAQLALIQFNHRRELLKYKHELDNDKNTINGDGLVTYNQEEIMNALDNFNADL